VVIRDKCGGFQLEWTNFAADLSGDLGEGLSEGLGGDLSGDCQLLLFINTLHLSVLFFNLAFE
jgi:hypothetical protein